MLRFNASTQVQQQNPTWDLEDIKSVLMLNIVINLVNKPCCFYWHKHSIAICLCGFVETYLKSRTTQTCICANLQHESHYMCNKKKNNEINSYRLCWEGEVRHKIIITLH